MPAVLVAVPRALRDADWLDAGRAAAYLRILIAATLIVTVVWLALSRGGFDVLGRPIGADFVSFWTASRLALAGQAAAPWDPARHYAAERAAFADDPGYFAFFYPPPFLIVCLPLALLPYLASLAVWLAATGFAYWKVLRALAPRLPPAAALAFPAVLINVGHGQNAFLTTALVGAGFLLLDARPLVAGALFGAMVVKPQLVLLLPFALAIMRRWSALAAAALTAAALCALSYDLFGEAAWAGFLRDGAFAREALEKAWIGDQKMQSVFAAARLLGAPLGLAYALQGLAALAALAALVPLMTRAVPGPAAAAAVVPACLLASPFLLDYDLMLIAIPLAWLAGEAGRTGFLPWEKVGLLAAFLLPLVSRVAAMAIGLPLGPPTIAAVFALAFRRRLLQATAGAGRPLSGRPRPASDGAKCSGSND